MAKSTVILGIKKIEIAKTLTDGKPGTVFQILGDTLEDSFNETVDEGTRVTVNIEESDTPIVDKPTGSTKSITWQVPNPDMDVLAEMQGGTWDEATKTYETPKKRLQEDYTVKLTFEQGGTQTYNRVNMDVFYDGAVGKNNVKLLRVNGTCLTPLDDATAPEVYVGV